MSALDWILLAIAIPPWIYLAWMFLEIPRRRDDW